MQATVNQGLKRLILALLLLPLLATAGVAATADWSAKLISLTMPDGVSVPMWIFDDGSNYSAATGAYSPPVIRTTDTSLTINLSNALPDVPAGVGEPVSLMIPGQRTSTPPTPVWAELNGTVVGSGSRPAGNITARVRSMDKEVAIGGTDSYNWSNLLPGTYLIQSATHLTVQVPMGLYGVLIVDSASGPPAQAYPGVSYTTDRLMVMSEVDLAMHNAKADGSYGSPAYPNIMTMGHEPRYFLVNGKPYSASVAPMTAVNAGDTVLLRCVNAGLRTRALSTTLSPLMIVAEDGNPYATQLANATVDLPAGQTKDILFTAPAAPATVPFFDRRLALSNGVEPNGGYMVLIPVGTFDTALNVAISGSGSGAVAVTSAPGGINCSSGSATGCSASYAAGSELRLSATPGSSASGLTGWSVVETATSTPTDECATLDDCVVALDVAKTVTANFDLVTATTLLRPVDGEIIPYDSYYTLQWAAPADAVSFDLAYSLRPGSPWVLIHRNVTGYSWTWQIPVSLYSFGSVRVAVVAKDAAGTIVGSDMTTASIELQSAALVAPNGGEVWAAGPHDVSWRNQAGAASVGLWYQQAPGYSWLPIASVAGPFVGATSSYSWEVPAINTTEARVVIRYFDEVGEMLLSDTSNLVFEISNAAAPAALSTGLASLSVVDAASVKEGLAVLAPNGGEVITTDGGFTLFWSPLDAAVSYTVELSSDGGSSWAPLAEKVETAYFDWFPTPEQPASTEALIRITGYNADGAVIGVDQSDAVFSIE